MNNNDDMDAEVIGMVNRGHNQRLPRATVTFIPADRAERVEKLDLRIRQVQKVAPFIGAAILTAAAFALGQMI